MKLRELINKLEQLSNNGKNDNMKVECWNRADQNRENGNDIGMQINAVYINWYITNTYEDKYIQIDID